MKSELFKPDPQGVILVNFGGPRSSAEIGPFLTNIFKDVLPRLVKFLAPLFAYLRKNHAKKMYDSIGGVSPVEKWTKLQAQALEKKLNGSFRIYIGMKYGQPSINEAIAKAKKDGVKKIILLPLFPYQSRCTGVAGFSLQQLTQIKVCYSINKPWHTHPLYIGAMVDIIKTALTRYDNIPPPNINLVFSVHAIPLSAVKAGDPYLKQVYESVSEIMKSFTGYNHYIAFQSAACPIRWTTPSTKEVLKRLKRLKHLNTQTLLVPLGFACENIETVYEIDKVYNITRTQALNDHPLFIDLLAKLVLESL